MTLAELTTAYERRQIIDYTSNGISTQCRRHEMQQVSGPLYKGRETVKKGSEPQFNLFLVFAGIEKGLVYNRGMKHPEWYQVEDCMETLQQIGYDTLEHFLVAQEEAIQHAGSRALPEKGYFVVNESACGSGAIMLSAADEIDAAGLNPSYQMVAQMEDLDPRCVHMAYIQMSLYGIPAVIIRGDVLALEEFDRWYTPAYILFDWVWREPMPFRPGRNRDDELLKMSVDPIYRAIRLMGKENHGK